MKGLREYEVSFSGLKQGKHVFEFPIDQKFFELFDTEIDFESYQGHATVILDKHSNFMEAEIKTRGKVTLLCDYHNEPFHTMVENSFPIIIKFGEEFDDQDDEVLILPHEAYQFNVAQYIYENILLSIPLKRQCEICESDEVEDFFEGDEQEEKEIDPRWDALKKLKKK